MEEKRNNFIGKLVFRFVKRHIAGSTSGAVLNVIRELNNKGMHTTVTLLNDHVEDQTKARYNTNAYIQFMRQLSRLHLDSDISVRPGQIGYWVDMALLERNMLDIISAANGLGQRLWLEDEESIGMESVIAMYRKFRPRCGTLGIDIRPGYDEEGRGVAKLLSGKDTVKLSYHPRTRRSKDERSKADAFRLYKGHIDALMSRKVRLTLFVHDEGMINRIISGNKEYRRNLIFEIPLGYNSNRLAKSRLNMSIYVPYGKDWIPYFKSRLAEGRMKKIAVKLLNGEKPDVGQNAKIEEKG